MTGHDDPFRDDLIAFLSGDLDDRAAAAMREHLGSCPSCNRELESLLAVWRDLGRVPDEIPTPRLASRFYEMLDAADRTIPARARPGRLDRLGWLLPRHPAVQFALVLVVLVVGGFIGYGLRENGARQAEMAQLREEVHSVSRLLIVSLLQQQSAAERLQGVSWSNKVRENDPEVTGALLQALAGDPNVNVRLAALDALSGKLTDPGVREGLLKAIGRQSSPLLQVAIVDVVVKFGMKESESVLREIVRQPDVDQTVRKRIEEALQHLST